MFASGLAFFLTRAPFIENDSARNVIDWVMFFGSYQNYTNLEDVCDIWCIVCVTLWLVCFAAGCFIQYKCHRRFKRKENDDGYESDSEMTEYDYSPENVPAKRSKKQKKERQRSEDDAVELGMASQIGYAGSLRVQNQNHYPLGSQSSQPGGGALLAEGTRPAASTIAMSEYGANYYGQNHGQPQYGNAVGMGYQPQYGNYGQRNDVQYV